MSNLRVTIDPALARNARLELQSRVEGALALNDNPVVILSGADFLEIQLPAAVPTEDVNSVIKALSSLVGRPGSGILSAATVTDPANTSGLPRTYSV